MEIDCVWNHYFLTMIDAPSLCIFIFSFTGFLSRLSAICAAVCSAVVAEVRYQNHELVCCSDDSVDIIYWYSFVCDVSLKVKLLCCNSSKSKRLPWDISGILTSVTPAPATALCPERLAVHWLTPWRQPPLKCEGLYTLWQTKVSLQCHQITSPLPISGLLRPLSFFFFQPCWRDRKSSSSGADQRACPWRPNALIIYLSAHRQTKQHTPILWQVQQLPARRGCSRVGVG